MTYRQIDARGIWAGDSAALQTFRKAFEHDCESDESLFLSVYGWKQEALADALRKSNAKPFGYLAISHDYSYAPLRVGLVVRRNADGKEIYCQPGDDENAMRENIDALDEISTDWHDSKRRTIADMMLGEYF